MPPAQVGIRCCLFIISRMWLSSKWVNGTTNGSGQISHYSESHSEIFFCLFFCPYRPVHQKLSHGMAEAWLLEVGCRELCERWVPRESQHHILLKGVPNAADQSGEIALYVLFGGGLLLWLLELLGVGHGSQRWRGADNVKVGSRLIDVGC